MRTDKDNVGEIRELCWNQTKTGGWSRRHPVAGRVGDQSSCFATATRKDLAGREGEEPTYPQRDTAMSAIQPACVTAGIPSCVLKISHPPRIRL